MYNNIGETQALKGLFFVSESFPAFKRPDHGQISL